MVERASLSEIDAAVGDTVAIELPQQPPVEMLVAGTAHDVDEIAPAFGGQLRAYVPPTALQALTGSSELDTLYLRAAVDPLDRKSAIAMTAAVRDDVLAPAG